MEKEFIKCEVNFKFKDGDFITGDRKVVCTSLYVTLFFGVLTLYRL